MVAQEFIDFLTKFQVTSYVGVEDFADKYNFHLTVIVLLLSTVLVTFKQYILKPISCYMSTDIGGKNLLNYLENYCWVQGTIPISYNSTIPTTKIEQEYLEDNKILYYQWVPFALGLQCIMFYIPRLMWQMICYNHTGTDIQYFITSANQAVHSSEEAKVKMVSYLAKSIAQTCYQHREYRHGPLANIREKMYNLFNFFVFSKRMGTRITIWYLFLKLLYLSNGIVQLYYMQIFLGIEKDRTNIFFGLQLLRNIFNGQEWRDSLIFPRIGYCFVEINNLGTSNMIVAQCVLPVNMLNERLYMFLWCWIMVGVILTLISFVVWLYRICKTNKIGFTKRFLIIKEIIKNDDSNDIIIKDFEKRFLRRDGLFLIKMISLNTGDVITGDLIVNLWEIFNSDYVNTHLFEKMAACSNRNLMIQVIS